MFKTIRKEFRKERELNYKINLLLKNIFRSKFDNLLRSIKHAKILTLTVSYFLLIHFLRYQ